MRVILITGSNRDLVNKASEIFKKTYNVPIIYSDRFIEQINDKSSVIYNKIREIFGEILDDNGTRNISLIEDIIKNQEKRESLYNMVKDSVKDMVSELIDKFADKGHNMIFVNSKQISKGLYPEMIIISDPKNPSLNNIGNYLVNSEKDLDKEVERVFKEIKESKLES